MTAGQTGPRQWALGFGRCGNVGQVLYDLLGIFSLSSSRFATTQRKLREVFHV